jgi:hypothetical protein
VGKNEMCVNVVFLLSLYTTNNTVRERESVMRGMAIIFNHCLPM